jgi:hypothetical protein
MNNRRIDVFFYGLFMDVDVLRKGEVEPINLRPALVPNFALRIGQRATLIASAGAHAYGMLISLSHEELARLYGAPGLERYHPEAVLAQTLDGVGTAALCYNLIEAPGPEERNPEYAFRLQEVLRKLDFPSEYVASIL